MGNLAAPVEVAADGGSELMGWAVGWRVWSWARHHSTVWTRMMHRRYGTRWHTWAASSMSEVCRTKRRRRGTDVVLVVRTAGWALVCLHAAGLVNGVDGSWL